MLAIERTTQLFVASIAQALPDFQIVIERSHTSFGRSNYIHLRSASGAYWKVRVSDHAVGMRRATSGREDLYLSAGTRPHRWAVWLGELVRKSVV